MHGVARRRERTSEEVEKKRKEEELKHIAEYKVAVQNASQKYKDNVMGQEGLQASAQALQFNSEYYSLWNYRRKIFEDMITNKSKEEMDTAFEQELRFLEKLQQVHPKSYWMWLHREWVLLHMSKPNWARELKLCEMLLDRDDRNFHGWNYRRFIAKNAPTTLQQEFDFTTKKIEKNFSNYSAWHHRSTLIPKMYGDDKVTLKKVLKEELDLIHNAMFTEPSDQSTSFYQLWIVDQISEIVSEEEKLQILEDELKICQELIALEENDPVQSKDKVATRKWPILTSNILMQKIGKYQDKIRSNLALLKQLDPIRTSYYEALEQKTQ